MATRYIVEHEVNRVWYQVAAFSTEDAAIAEIRRRVQAFSRPRDRYRVETVHTEE